VHPIITGVPCALQVSTVAHVIALNSSNSWAYISPVVPAV